MLKDYSITGWPAKTKLEENIRPYYQYRFEISFVNDILLRNNRIIIPSSLQLRCLEFLHRGHQGIVKCRARAKTSVWWLGLSSQIENLIRNCPQCVEHQINFKEPFLKDSFPERPWQKIALDLFKIDSWYLIVTDYYSRFFEIFKLNKMTEFIIIAKLKTLFSRFGIPEIVRSDNGPQFQSEFKKFAYDYDFHHITSSPYFPQSNGCIEAAVKIAKSLIKKNPGGLDLALLAYRTTPLDCGYSPSELLMNRKLRSHLPILPSQLNKAVNAKLVFKREDKAKDKSIDQFNKRHRARNLSELKQGDSVWVIDLRIYGKIIEVLREPRSYMVETNFGIYRRNRYHLVPAPYYILSPPLISTLPQPQPSENSVNIDSKLMNKSSREVSTNITTGIHNSSDNVVSSPPWSVPPLRRSTRNSKRPAYLKDYVT
ncbi:hypothetical protein Zmor_006241 [Zophobas morio]|uniref:RNA-directed DNA polymerase n=1 Tax=Zophobas morio TaxID=2755281 RepID=A0AA38IRI0_9CUCU|nr:hypothetical protein Zmor_006241 [Zophobas morio]